MNLSITNLFKIQTDLNFTVLFLPVYDGVCVMLCFQESPFSQKIVRVTNLIHMNSIIEFVLALNSNSNSSSFHYEKEQVIYYYLFKYI